MNPSPFLSVNRPCDETLQWTKNQLSQAGLRPIQTFDLHAARGGAHDCPCPNHGTKECDCQLIVLLVYGKTAEPVTLILHGNGGQTGISIGENSPQTADLNLITVIQQALTVKSSAPVLKV